MAKHPVHLHPAGEVVAYAHPKTGVVLPYQLLYVPQTVVSAVASARLQAQRAQRQRHIVDDYKQSLLVYVLLVEPVSHGIYVSAT